MAGYGKLVELLAGDEELVRICVARTRGSTPREEGAWMIVSGSDQAGTIGGGQLEKMAIDEARQLLASTGRSSVLDIPLGPEIGQCCGGRVSLTVEKLDNPSRQAFIRQCELEFDALPRVYVFGAGHVGKALGEALSLLPVHTVLVETRSSELELATDAVEKNLTAVPESIVASAPPGSAYVILTHDHALDFLIVERALARSDAAYVGMIGSRTKRARFKRWLATESGSDADASGLVCPIGASTIRDKRPQIIAALVAAEVVTTILSFRRGESD